MNLHRMLSELTELALSKSSPTSTTQFSRPRGIEARGGEAEFYCGLSDSNAGRRIGVAHALRDCGLFVVRGGFRSGRQCFIRSRRDH